MVSTFAIVLQIAMITGRLTPFIIGLSIGTIRVFVIVCNVQINPFVTGEFDFRESNGGGGGGGGHSKPLKMRPLWARIDIIAYCPLRALPLAAPTIFSAWLDYSTK